MEYYVLEALCKMDECTAARDRMLERYADMIDADYSTLWEKWTNCTGTMNHAWSGEPLVIMSKYFAGIRPIQAGYSEYIIKPEINDSDTVSCVVPSVKGYIDIEAKKSGNSFILDAGLPADAKAFIYLPYSDGQSVKLNGSLLFKNGKPAEAENVSFIEIRNNSIVFSVKPRDNIHCIFNVSG